jgi:hypothetical protein
VAAMCVARRIPFTCKPPFPSRTIDHRILSHCLPDRCFRQLPARAGSWISRKIEDQQEAGGGKAMTIDDVKRELSSEDDTISALSHPWAHAP